MYLQNLLTLFRRLTSSPDIQVCGFALACLIAATLSRCEPLGLFKLKYLHGFFWLQFTYFTIVLLQTRPRLLLGLTVLCALILGHSFANLYWPSMRWGFPVQDYLLHDEVSSNYSFDFAKQYLMHMMWFVPAGLAAGLAWPLSSARTKHVFFTALLLGFGLNYLAVWVQGANGLDFLMAGSGSSLAGKRAPGLLEDSGASTIYLASSIAALLGGLAMTRSLSLIWRLAFALFIGIGLWTGYFTGGRIYFIGLGFACLSIALLFVAKFVKTTSRRLACLAIGISISAVAIWYIQRFATGKLRYNFKMTMRFFEEGGHDLAWLATRIDPGRIGHWQVMLHDFQLHWLFGSGLGSYHANYLTYWQQLGITKLVDNPSGFYPMLLAALGVAGILLVVILGLLFAKLILASLDDSSGPIVGMALGACLVIFISWFIGIHLIFVSFASLLGLCCMGLTSLSPKALGRLDASIQVLALVAMLHLLGRVIGLAATAPPSPEFRWAERGKAQVPLSLLVPISAHGHEGIWLSNKGELQFVGQELEVFVEMPPDYYPLEIEVEILDHKNVSLWRQSQKIADYDLPKPGRLLKFQPGEQLRQDCASRNEVHDYCLVTFRTRPEWRWDGQRVGLFVLLPKAREASKS